MKARHALAAVMISAFAATPAAATVLSASSHAVGTKPSKADYLRVTEVQKELNASMEGIHDAAVANGPLTSDVPSTGEGGYLYDREGEGGINHSDYDPFAADPTDDGLDHDRLSLPSGTRGGTGTDYSNNRRHMDNRGGGGGGRHGGGAHATPEPSTWMLLGAGLALFGGYAMLRRPGVM